MLKVRGRSLELWVDGLQAPTEKPSACSHEYQSIHQLIFFDRGYQVGTLDSLMTMSDELTKIDAQVEAAVKKIQRSYYEVIKTKPLSADELKEQQVKTQFRQIYQQMKYC